MKERILEYINSRGSCTTQEIADATGISAYQARHYLMTLDREKKIRRTPLRQEARTLWGVLREK
ncbi:FaeA/PapI family transcriptional regulator [Escherichia coli]|uniref:FaeA/PapI family transcriptional regulator n=1 Tax=Escherichia coli TaxID=562 RepID=UPI000CFBBBEE|nr:FaeA/PapI family transcriptional regulator [Escherichia coli]MJY49191.1 DeoR family transcriptional regulator [Escherichia coli]QLM28789.1 DeoR family transcriptional regulator [Escherichia coli]QMB13712.1 DeoR family transcriptional regulator [Escherichia coli]HAN4397694.1 DeoR family transcriptional regulator [Escherichia coli]HCO7773546.1 FaeA/PapI family transcriptional regulator [Escherichia coli]